MFPLPDMSSKVKKTPKKSKTKLFSSDSRNLMFCVTQISMFRFGFKRCQVAGGEKKRHEGEGMVFSNPKLLHITKSLPPRSMSAPLKCLLVSRSKTAGELFAALQSILTDPNP